MAPKKKQEKMALGDFLTNQSLGSWADEMDSQPLPQTSSTGYSARDRGGAGEGRAFASSSWERSGAGTSGGSGMGSSMGGGSSFDRPRYDREEIPFPTRPPYTAHLGNLDYNVTSVDIEEFLSDCSVTTVRIMEDKVDRKPKGFGYVEFGSPEGLRQALTKSESSFMGRNIKISVADPPKNDRPEQTRDFSDWSRRGPLPDLPNQERQGSNRGFPSRSFDNRSDAGSERDGPGGRKPGFFEGDGKVRDFSNWERRGPLSPAPGAGPPVRDGGRLREPGPPREREGASWGEGRGEGQSDAGSRPPRKEFEPRPVVDRVPTAAEQDNQWRSKMRPDPSPAATPDVSTPASPAQPEAPKERVRLNLAKRTVSTAETNAASTSSGDAKASPFGAARPIDTQQREKEIEEKREAAAKEKKAADDKAKEEKAARETEARAARGDRADRAQAEGETVTSPTGERPKGDRRPSRQQQNGAKQQPKENGEAARERPSFSILQREEGEDAGAADAVDASANGKIIGDKETKPQEIVVPADGSAANETTAEGLEDDGWSTVAAKPKNNRRGGGRAIAS
ncbi:unnamed protein product [Zymoseptoria tritici ST99CH_1E4]|uniref:RRM domain-containing protein n=1 Tax=Zymoseptoria tritici ST99CH_1E4 TaxID=1276532 RepID=A0A2H1FYR7_ZYMTR|nr:unnamed protein product [Zymoseptoria tritici ST99CH_1E4]